MQSRAKKVIYKEEQDQQNNKYFIREIICKRYYSQVDKTNDYKY